MERKRILTRAVWMLSLISLFTDVASEMLYPIMPVYLKSIGFSVLMIGVLEGLAEAVAGFSKGYFGNLSDKIKKRVPFIRAGYGLSAISKPLMGLFIAPVWIFLARTMDRLGKGLRTSARDALLSDETTAAYKARVFGFHRGMDTLGAAIGPFLAMVFLFYHPAKYSWLFLIAFFPGLAAVSITLMLKEKKSPEQHAVQKRPSFFDFIKYWKIASTDYKLLVAGLLAFTLFNSSDAFLLLLLKSRGISDMALIGFYIFYNIVYALMSYPMGSLADKIGLRIVLLTGFCFFIIVYASMGFVTAFWMFGLIFLIYGFYASAVEGISKALITNIAARQDTATAVGFFNSFSSLFALISSSLAGFIWYIYSPKAMFLYSAAGVASVVIFLSVAFYKRKGKLQA